MQLVGAAARAAGPGRVHGRNRIEHQLQALRVVDVGRRDGAGERNTPGI
jgi:hypothetical protein